MLPLAPGGRLAPALDAFGEDGIVGREDDMQRRLRWMRENLGGAYRAQHPKGDPRENDHCTNSGTCILACCYINALGKVLLKGGPPKRGHQRRDFERFQKFIQCCMKDLLTESNALSLPPTPKGNSGGDEWLYEAFRCGFVHGYPGATVAWGRNPRSKRYWSYRKGRLTLNIDELVRGFERGIVEFECLAKSDPELRSRFKEFITKD
jgi:hypothetical protein